MQPIAITRFISPWTFRRDQQQQRFEKLRERDGDHCWRCRRPMDFDLPRGHAQAPTIELLRPTPRAGTPSKGGIGTLDNLCLCHGRCNAMTGDATPEVLERVRLRA